MLWAETLTHTAPRAPTVVNLRKSSFAHGDGVKGAVAGTRPIPETGVFANRGTFRYHKCGSAVLNSLIIEQRWIHQPAAAAVPLGKFYLPILHGQSHNFRHFFRRLLGTHYAHAYRRLSGYNSIGGGAAARIATGTTIGSSESIFHPLYSRVHIHIKQAGSDAQAQGGCQTQGAQYKTSQYHLYRSFEK
jgi:hypothetical protein